MDNKKDNRGGSRPGSGQKPKYNEPTVTVSFRVPASKADDIKAVVNKKLKIYEKRS